MKRFLVKLKTAWDLGVLNILRVLWYRVGVKFGFNAVRRIQAAIPQGIFFRSLSSGFNKHLEPSESWLRETKYFGFHPVTVEGVPDWHLNPLLKKHFTSSKLEWWKIPDFDPQVGDIKSIWEASRFDWVLSFAQQACIGNPNALSKLNLWLNDWIQKNPPYNGPNWKCGQEASIRVMHLVVAAMILEQTRGPSSELLDLLDLHLQRIEPTISYAIGQDNNHGTSEAAALFMGGSLLTRVGNSRGVHWQSLGRKWLENRVHHLIGDQGTFSQYSTNYHRMMLDTLSMSEVVRRHFGISEFSSQFYQRAKAATQWLYTLTDPATGDVPNWGANDGARLLPLVDTDYRDYRPSVQLAMVLFCQVKAWKSDDASFNLPLKWLGVSAPERVAAPAASVMFDDGGLAVIIREDIKALLRYPRFKFRPSHADVLHIDLWKSGVNLLRDAGTYGYNVESKWLNYFPGTVSHNTIEFDGRDQMPRLSRFLFGNWIKTKKLMRVEKSQRETAVGAGYEDSEGVSHFRKLSVEDKLLRVQDFISGFKEKAILRWRLAPGDWTLQGQSILNGQHQMTVVSSMPIKRIELTTGWESLYYQHKTLVPVLEVEFSEPGEVTTEYRWSL